MESKLKNIAIVMPCYNEARRLQAEFIAGFLAENTDITICFVNDGSTDSTLDVLNDIKVRAGDRAEILDLESNMGKAAAVREGVMHLVARGGFGQIGFWDADLQIPLMYIPAFSQKLLEDDRLMVTACRVKRLGSEIETGLMRHLVSRSFATAVSFALSLPVYDTQCGAKLLRADMAARVFEKPFVSKWIFDVEIFARLIKLVGRKECRKRILEFPLEKLSGSDGSRIKIMDWLMLPVEILKIMSAYGLMRSSD